MSIRTNQALGRGDCRQSDAALRFPPAAEESRKIWDTSAGTGKLCILGHLGLVFIWSCFVSCLLFLLFYVSLRNLCSGTCRKIQNLALPRCKNLWNSRVALNKENKEVNIIDPNPNNSYKTKEKFTGSYTEENLKIFCLKNTKYRHLWIISCSVNFPS